MIWYIPCIEAVVNGVVVPGNEITSTLSLIDDTGEPQNFGWARQPHFFFDPSLIWAPQRKLTESDRYIIFNPTHIVILEIRDDGYLGYMGISIVSVKEKKRSSQIFQSILPLGSYEMPPDSQRGALQYRRKKTILDFVPMDGGARIVKIDVPKFGHYRRMRGELVLSGPPMAESLVNNLPWRSDKYAFRYSRCSPWYTAEGVIQFGGAEIIFTSGNAWGIYDWNRSVRPRADIRYWAAACGMSDGRLAGFSVGHSSADSSVGTENAFFVDGRLHKLDQVTFHIPPSNWLSPWRYTSNDNRLEMTFTPLQERIDRRRLMFHSVTRRQVLGNFSGKVILDDGAQLDFHNITGFAERCKMRF